MSTNQHIKLDYLQTISGNDMPFCREILELFIQQITSDVADVERYYQNNRLEDLRYRSHAMRSTSSSLQLQQLSQSLRHLEEQTQTAGDSTELKTQVDDVTTQCHEAIAEAHKLLEQI